MQVRKNTIISLFIAALITRCTSVVPGDMMEIFRPAREKTQRADRQPGDQNDRICSCHFKDGKKEGDSAYFAWNEGKAMDFSDPECTKRRKKLKSEESLSSSQMDQLQIPQAPKCQYQEKLISEHNYSVSCTFNCTQEMQRLSTEIQLEKELLALKIESSKRKPISIHDIKYNEEKVSDQQGHFLYIKRKWRLPTHPMYFVGQFSVHCSHQYIQISSPAQTSFTPLNCAGSSKVSSFEMVTVSNTLKSQDSNFIHVHR
ncbi:uncharacterized protein LOC134268094 isoform X1 [Saccostrea cucullata]|uniref:uncharacterized protein LOC134268094 isoform X1 n=1 Tax=Saccostrea cuccullata TaxID=36930 RepID=UPI002ED55EC3